MTSSLGFIDPSAGGGKTMVRMALRPDDLAGKVLGLLDNTKEQGTLILETLGQALRERFGVAGVVLVAKEHFSKPALDSLIDSMAAEVDIAIAAVGG